MKCFRLAALALWALIQGTAATADPAPAPALHDGQSKLLLTGGVSSIDGAAGGGLTPWAVTGSYATDGEFGGTAYATHLSTQNYALSVYGVAGAVDDRVEFSLAQQALDAGVVVPGTTLRLDIVAVKVRLAGEAVLDSDRWMPQLALGAQYKHLNPGQDVGAVLDSVGARRDGVDLYLSASKLLLGPSLLLNGTLRATRANQDGLLGFGSSQHAAYRLEPEGSLAWLVHKSVALGVEYRAKPNNLAFAGPAFAEQAWRDAFLAWAPNKRVSLTAAWVDLGNVVGHAHERGAYLSLQLAH